MTKLATGLAISKAKLDTALSSGVEPWSVSNDRAGLKEFVEKLKPPELERIIVEATGGWERVQEKSRPKTTTRKLTARGEYRPLLECPVICKGGQHE